MSAASLIAREEWRVLTRNRAGLIASALLVVLILVASFTSLERRSAIEADRERYQTSADETFDAQPDRHPHRMVHYGQFVFRPIAPLAFFDAGVDSFTGNTVFLEGHRQNSANFAEARQSSLLLRFGQLTPAFILQTLAPLLIIFLAFASVAREKENATLKLMLAQGVSGRSVIAGKLLGHGAIALGVGVPAFAVLIAFAATGAAEWASVALIVLGYASWLLLWAALGVVVSALVAKPRDALAILIGLWMVIVILLPRALPEAASAQSQLATKIETEIALHRDLLKIGDSHDPDDPYFNDFRDRVLARYGAETVEDLPVQYAGLVSIEGERLTTQIYADAANRQIARESDQNAFVHAFSVVSPLIAIRQLSMALAGSDPAAHYDFLEQAETFRYNFVQRLNRMQAELLPGVKGDDPRISAAYWQQIPRFAYTPVDPLARPGSLVWPFLVLLGWLAALTVLAILAARRIGRAAR
ncbi:MAG: ABC transporter permease [Sphingomonas sp.]|nr:ABC transporter permease [Sphingomonas sp.]MAX00843.1 ABC transporter permease [Sphingomonas sp.]